MENGRSAAHVKRKKTTKWRRAVGLVAIACVIGVGGYFASTSFEAADLIRIVDEVQAYGRHWWAPIALILAMIVINLIGLPGTPLTLACGVVWGWKAGGAWMMLATMIGTAPPFYLARRGMPLLSERIRRRFPKTVEWIRGSGFTAIALLRLAHIFPFALISYAAGLAKVRARDYFGGTFVGTLPGIFINTYLADAIVEGVMSTADAKRRIALSAALLAAFIILTNLIAQRIRRKGN